MTRSPPEAGRPRSDNGGASISPFGPGFIGHRRAETVAKLLGMAGKNFLVWEQVGPQVSPCPHSGLSRRDSRGALRPSAIERKIEPKAFLRDQGLGGRADLLRGGRAEPRDVIVVVARSDAERD